MARRAPEKSHRKGITLMQLMAMFPDEITAARWFEELRWPDERECPHCGSENTMAKANRRPLPSRCRDCRKFFSVRHGSVMECSRIPLRKWAIAIYLCATSLKGVSSMKLHRDLGITQKSAWFMAHRLREAFATDTGLFTGPVEVDETYVGGKRRNMSTAKRRTLVGRGPAGKAAVVGANDRATNRVAAKAVDSTNKETLQGFVLVHAAPEAEIYTDEAKAYKTLPFEHEAVKHSAKEYVRGAVHTNGVESFWSMLKRAHKGTFHKLSPKHLDRYVQEFAGRHNVRGQDTKDQLEQIAGGMNGKRLTYKALIRDNGRASGANAQAYPTPIRPVWENRRREASISGEPLDSASLNPILRFDEVSRPCLPPYMGMEREWCNGSTPDSKSRGAGSTPVSRSTRRY